MSVLPPHPEDEAPHPPLRAPLVWLVLVLVAGYALGEALRIDRGEAVVLALIGLIEATCGLLVAAYWRGPHRQWLWTGSFVLAGVLTAMGWQAVRAPVAYEQAQLPPREATLSLRIEQVFDSPEPERFRGGLARVAEAPVLLRGVEGTLVAFGVDPQGHEPVRGSVWTMRGLLQPVVVEEDDRFRAYLRERGAWLELRRGEVVASVRHFQISPANIP